MFFRFFSFERSVKYTSTPKETTSNFDESQELPDPPPSTSKNSSKRGLTKNQPKQLNKKQRMESIERTDDMIMETVKSINIEKQADTQQEHDSDTLFCQSLVGRLRELPKKQRHLCRLKFEQILFSLEFGEAEE